MKIWSKILLFFPVWIAFSSIFYGVIFLISPGPAPGSTAFDLPMFNNFEFLFLSQLAMFLGTFSALFFIFRFVDKQKPEFLSSMLKPEGLIFGVVFGAVQILLAIIILSLTTKIKITFNGLSINLLSYAILFFLVAVSEEVISRGLIFSNLYNHSNKYLAILISSMIFSLMHSFNASFNWIAMANIFLSGIFFCQLYLRGMNLSAPIGFHFSWNLLQGPVFGFSVSGYATEGILKIERFSGLKFSFEGFGLEGSLISVFVLFFFIVCLYFANTRKVLQQQKPETLLIKVSTLNT